MSAALIPPSPRRVPSAAVQGVADVVFWLVGGIFLLIGTILSVVFLRTLPIDLALDLGASTAAQAAIESMDLDTSISVNGEHPVDLRYTFEVNGATVKGHSQTFNYSWVDSLEANPTATVDVEYVASRPQWSRLKGTMRTPGGYWLCFILLFPLVGAGLVLGGTLPRLRRARVYRHGEGILAKLESVGLNHSVTVNGRHPTRVRWSFQVQGQRYDGSWSGFNAERFLPKDSSDQLPVIYDPKDPKRSTLFIG
jgi:hypothetical protein